jgi:hypothetical protein
MYRPLRRSTAAALVGGLALLGLSACSDGTAPSTPALSQAQADTIAEVISSDIDDANDGLTSGASNGLALSASALPVRPASLSVVGLLGLECTPRPARTPADPTPPADQDGDFVPDSVRWTFDPPCVLSLPLRTITRTGTVDLVDPTPTEADFARRVAFTDFTTSVERLVSGATVSATRNGTRVVTGDADALQHTVTGFATEFTHADGSTSSHVRTWTSAFSADVAGSIARNQPLPSGTWNISGTSTWTRGNRTWSLAITTNPPLHYNASCAEAPRFDAGTLTAVATRNGASATVTIVYTACGEYTVTRS